jgi:hypothetical protein
LHVSLMSKRERFFQAARALAEIADSRRLFVFPPATPPGTASNPRIGTALAQ